ncbi:MAG: pilin [Candidatus Moraniibacteriota bacterium]
MPDFLNIFQVYTAKAVTISFDNPIGETGDITQFFQSVTSSLMGIIAFLSVLFIVIAGIMYLMASSSGNDKMAETAKKMWAGALAGLALALAGPTFLKEIKEILIAGEEVPTQLNEAPTLTEIVERTLSFLLSILGILAIIGTVISGFFYLSSSGDPKKAEKAKNAVVYSIIGVIVAGSALILVQEITNLITN